MFYHSVLPAGILQRPFFSREIPRYMNYGATGITIGHEIAHGFDTNNRRYDKSGKLVDWWTVDSNSTYLEKAKCMIQQYGNYKAEKVELHVGK